MNDKKIGLREDVESDFFFICVTPCISYKILIIIPTNAQFVLLYTVLLYNKTNCAFVGIVTFSFSIVFPLLALR